MSTVVSDRAGKLAETLASQQVLIDEGCRILKHMSQRFGAVKTAYEPVRLQSLDLNTSQKNAEALKTVATTLLEHLKAAEKLRQLLQADATLESNLAHFLGQLEAAERATQFFLTSTSLEVSTEAISDLKQVTAHAYRKCGQLVTRALQGATRIPAKREIEETLTVPPPARPRAVELYVTDASAAPEVARLAKVMLDAGEMGCVTAYGALRHEVVIAEMRAMGAQLEGIASGMAAPQERRIDDWTFAMRVLAQLVDWESELAGHFFQPPFNSQALLRSVRGACDALLAQASEFVRLRGQPEKLFQVLQMMACLRSSEVAPLFAKAFEPAEMKPLADKLALLIRQLQGEGRALADAFSDAVSSDATPLVVKDVAGATSVAPQTAFAMRFLKNIFRAEVAGQLTFLDSPREFALRTIHDLQSNLEAKVAASVKDPAAAAIIMLNNVNYVRICIEEHRLLSRELGEGWASKQLLAIKRWKSDYVHKAWDPLLAAVQVAAHEASPQMKKESMKEHFKRINARLEKLHEQALWSMHDTTLRSHMRASILDAFLPLYTDLWERYQGLALVKTPAKYLRYSPADLQEFIEHALFSAKVPRQERAGFSVPKALKKLTIDSH